MVPAMRQVNLNTLRVFASVARHGSLQGAADALNLSRGAVSQRVKQLEIDLGVVLLTRQARGVSLTPAGERCRTAVDEALAIVETALVELGRTKGQITLHLGSSFATKWLMPRMARFAARFPAIALATEVHDRRLDRNLGQNEIAIWPGKAPDANLAHCTRHLTELRLVGVCSPDLARPDSLIGLETLLTLPLLQDAHRRWEQLIEVTGQRATYSLLNFDRSALALDAAMSGHGVAIAPTYMIEEDVRAGRLVEIWFAPEPSGEHLFVSWPTELVGQRPLGRVVNWVLTEFGQRPIP